MKTPFARKLFVYNRSLWISILFGLLGFFLSPFGIVITWGEVTIHLPWSIVFPLLASMAYGWRYGIVAGLAGGALFPFLLWANNGWAVVSTSACYLLFYSALGVIDDEWLKKRIHSKAIRFFTVLSFCMLVFGIYYLILFNLVLSLNPPFWHRTAITHLDTNLLLGFLYKDFINFSAFVLITKTLLKLPFVCTFLNLPLTDKMKPNNNIFIFTTLTSIGIWLIYIGLGKTLLQGENELHTEHITLAFFVIITSGIIASKLLINYSEKQLHTQIELNKSKEKFRILFEQAAVGVAQIDTNTGRFTRINKKYAEMIGYTIEEMLELDFQRITHHEDLQTDLDNMQRLIAGELQEYTMEKRYFAKNGNIVWVELTVSPMWKPNTSPDFHIAVVSEITKRKQAEQTIYQQNKELQKLNNDKDRFISILAHDLRSPFQSLLGFSDLLLENVRVYDSDKIERQLTYINQTTHKTYNLLEDLLLWSKSKAGKLLFEPQMIVFLEICTDIISQYQDNSKQITINCFELEPVILRADANMFKTIMRNLISNAVKFTNKNGRINIFAEIEKQKAKITVSDNGVGMDKDQQSKLWELSNPFSTLGTDNEKGTGLGLLLCKELVVIHQGEIWVESEVGKGSKFIFTLPILMGDEMIEKSMDS